MSRHHQHRCEANPDVRSISTVGEKTWGMISVHLIGAERYKIIFPQIKGLQQYLQRGLSIYAMALSFLYTYQTLQFVFEICSLYITTVACSPLYPNLLFSSLRSPTSAPKFTMPTHPSPSISHFFRTVGFLNQPLRSCLEIVWKDCPYWGLLSCITGHGGFPFQAPLL
jgi:hypothetical protein